MEHPVQYLARVTKFLDRMIEEHGDQLFVVFGFICLGVIVGSSPAAAITRFATSQLWFSPWGTRPGANRRPIPRLSVTGPACSRRRKGDVHPIMLCQDRLLLFAT